MRSELVTEHPLDLEGVFRFLSQRAIAGVEIVEADDPERLRYARTLALPGGPSAVDIVATPTSGGWTVRLDLELAAPADEEIVVARVRRLLDLDTDPLAVDAALADDDLLAPLVAERPGIRVPGTMEPHELVIRALVGQQISVAAARTHLGRLAAGLGTPYSSRFPGLERVFPAAADIAQGLTVPAAGETLEPDRVLRLPGRAIASIVHTARAIADGALRVDAEVDGDALRTALVARPGIGPWTAAYVAMRVLGDRDAWLTGDVALVAGAVRAGVLDGQLPRPAAHRELARTAQSWSPWRSYAAMHLWRVAAVSPPPAR